MCRPWSSGWPQKTGRLGPLGDLLAQGNPLFCRNRVLERSAVADEIADTPDGDPVEHDRRDHLVGADRRLQEAGDPGPHGARQSRRDDRHEDVQPGGQEVEPDADLDGGDRADDVLALPADVEEPAAEGEGHGQAREDEDGELDQRLLEVAGSHAELVARIPDGAGRVPRKEPVEPRAVEDLPVRRQRVLAAEDEDDQAGDEEGKDGRHERRHDPAGALVDSEARCDAGRRPRLCRRRGGCRRLLAHAAASPFTVPPIIAMPSSSSVTSVPYSATIAPSYMTSIRSESDRISSSSSETSNTPLPRSRASTSCRWTNSIAPTSNPRVGWAARRMFGSRPISRASTTFCWLPPESAEARVSGPPPRTSKRWSSSRARLMIRAGNSQPKREFGSSS